MKILLFILLIFSFACSKQTTFKVIAHCDNCTLDIILDNGLGSKTFDIQGDFKQKFNGNNISIDLKPKLGTIATVEIFKNGDLCNSESGYVGEQNIYKSINC